MPFGSVTLSERRLEVSDLAHVQECMDKLVAKLKARDTKAVYKHLDARIAFLGLLDSEEVWVIDETYLVAFAITTPWYLSVQLLQELLVLRLRAGGHFCVVTDFLLRKAKEAGCVMIGAGTALAPYDRTLASMYEQQGYRMGAYTLTKDI